MNAVVLNPASASEFNQIIELAKKLKNGMTSLSEPLSEEEIEDIEDGKMLKRMLAARAEGYADTAEVLAKLGL